MLELPPSESTKQPHPTTARACPSGKDAGFLCRRGGWDGPSQFARAPPARSFTSHVWPDPPWAPEVEVEWKPGTGCLFLYCRGYFFVLFRCLFIEVAVDSAPPPLFLGKSPLSTSAHASKHARAFLCVFKVTTPQPFGPKLFILLAFRDLLAHHGCHRDVLFP